VSYLERFDLAHIDPSDSGFDALGKGVEEGRPGPAAARYVSKGLTRSRTDKLVVMPGGATSAPSSPSPLAEGRVGGSTNVTAFSGRQRVAGRGLRHDRAQNEPEQKLSPAEQLEQTAMVEGARSRRRPRRSQSRRRREARGSQGQGLRRRVVRRMRQLHAGAQRDVHEVRHVRVDHWLQLTTTGCSKAAASSLL